MAALDLNGALEGLVALLAGVVDLVLLDALEGLFDVLLGGHVGVADSAPSFFLGSLEVTLLLPAGLVVGPVMEIDAAVAERAVPRVVPILTQPEVVVKPAGVPDGRVDSRGTLTFSELFLSVDNLLLGQRIVGITINAPVYRGINLALLDVLGHVDVFHVLLFSEFLLKDQLLLGMGGFLLFLFEGGVLGGGVVERLELVVELGLLLVLVL